MGPDCLVRAGAGIGEIDRDIVYRVIEVPIDVFFCKRFL